MADLLRKHPSQPKVTCVECGTELGEGTTKDVFSHLVTCLHVSPNSLENIADAARDTHNEHGKRVLHIVDALQESLADGIVASRDLRDTADARGYAGGDI